jgi:hypothetical protein
VIARAQELRGFRDYLCPGAVAPPTCFRRLHGCSSRHVVLEIVDVAGARSETERSKRSPNDGDPGQRLSEEGESRPSSRARFTASARLCTPSLAYTLRKWVLIVFSDTNSSAAISGAGRLVGR